jgi:hypothetical protein
MLLFVRPANFLDAMKDCGNLRSIWALNSIFGPGEGAFDMSDGLHPMAPHHLPSFISGPHEGDPLYVIVTLIVLAAVIGLGVLFFTLHSLPERMGHKKLQFEIVAVLGLLSLFTHIHAFWVAALLLALIDLPDFVTPLKRMAAALDKLSGTPPPPGEAPPPSEADRNLTDKREPGPPVPAPSREPAIPAVAPTPSSGG